MDLTQSAQAGGDLGAWRVCAEIAGRHYENFTVGSRVLPQRLRRHIWAVYAYCRTVDDLGDEAPGDRLALLDAWEAELHACFAGTARHPVTRALAETVRTFSLGKEPFLKLIEANRRDQRVNRYATYADLLEYCALSANPVGHLVLGLLGCDSARTRALADATCTALQLTNFWQDVARDAARDRVYIPVEDMERFGYSVAELRAGRVNDALRALIAFEVARTRALFDAGDALLAHIPGRFRVDVALFSMGGRAILDRIERARYDVLTSRPTLGRPAKAGLLLKALWRHAPGLVLRGRTL